MKAIKLDSFFAQFRLEINKLALGKFLFDSSDVKIIESQYNVKQSFLPLPSSAQHAESKVKDTDFCGITSWDEIKISNLSMILSVALSKMTYAAKERNEFNSKRG